VTFKDTQEIMAVFQSAWRRWKATWRYPRTTFQGIILRRSSIITSTKRLSRYRWV